MVMVIDNKASTETAPEFKAIGLEESVLKKCVIDSGLAIFASSQEDRSEATMCAAVRYVLENDTFIKGNLVYVGRPKFSFHEISSTHSMVMLDSAKSFDMSFAESNSRTMRRAADLTVFDSTGDKSKTIEGMLSLALTGSCVFGQIDAKNIDDVVQQITCNEPLETQTIKIWDFIEATKMVLCQKIIEDVEGKRFAVWEYLSLDKQVKELLFEALKSAEGIEAVRKRIKEIVSNGDFDSKGFKSQADDLLKNGTIDENAYKALIRVDM